MDEGGCMMEDERGRMEDVRGGCQGTGPWHRVFSSLEFLYQSSPNSSESLQLYTWKSK